MRIWGSCISELFSLKLSYIQIFFSRIQYSPSDFQILWIKLTVRSSWKKELTTKYCPRRTVLCCWKNHRIKQLKQTQDDQFKKIYYCWSIFSSPCWTQKTFVNTYFQIPLLALPHPCRHSVYSFPHCLGAMKTGSRERSIFKLLVTSRTPTTTVPSP